MSNRYIVIDGKRYLWADILRLRKERRELKASQPTLFPLVEDVPLPSQTTAEGRFLEPTLLDHLKK